LYTQSTGLQNKLADNNVPSVKFIANGAVHEYISEGTAHAAIDIAAIANFRRLSAAASIPRAKAEIAARGLTVTVAVRYYPVKAALEKVMTAKELLAAKGEEFLKLTQNLKHGGEIAHSDVIKAELQMLDRKRQVQEAQLGLLNARLDLSVIIFADFNDNFEVVDDLHATPPAACAFHSSASVHAAKS
jgi:outer membrane protein TolC